MQTSPSRFRLWHPLAIATATVVSASPALAQGDGWRFTAPEGARAWFAVMAGTRIGGLGPLPYYRRQAAASVPDSTARAIGRDPAFEVLHFLPLYFPAANARAVSGALRAAADGRVPARGHPAAFTTAALTSVLPGVRQRATLATLAGTVERAAASLPAPPAVARWQQRWDTAFAPRLAPYLAAMRLQGGIVIVAEALGAEGRIFAGRPDDATDNVIAVTTGSPGSATNDEPDATLFAVLRELCYPLVTRLSPSKRSGAAGRDDQAVRASNAAVRCGERLTARALPELAGDYRRQWLAFTGRPPSADPFVFQEAFPIDSMFDEAITAELARTIPARSNGRRAP